MFAARLGAYNSDYRDVKFNRERVNNLERVNYLVLTAKYLGCMNSVVILPSNKTSEE